MVWPRGNTREKIVGKWTRRAFLTAGAAIGGGMLLGVGTVVLAPNRMDDELQDGEAYITTWIKILPDNTVQLLVPHCEMGQGAQHGIAMMLAEELDVEWEQMQVLEAPAQLQFANDTLIRFMVSPPDDLPGVLMKAFRYYSHQVAQDMTLMVTGGSSSIRFTGQHGMRKAGAAARLMLCQAAAEHWGVPLDEIEASRGYVEHKEAGLRASYGELADAAAKLTAPADVPLKERKDFHTIGRSIPRFDIPRKVEGSPIFGIDVDLPDMLYAAILANPVRGGGLLSVDASPARQSSGVVDVVELDDAVAVVADSTWRAESAVRKLFPRFGDGGHGNVSSESLERDAWALLSQSKGEALDVKGDVASSWDSASKTLESDYMVPFLHHATMEPMACTAQFRDGKIELWAGTQDPLNYRNDVAKALSLEWENVTLHNLMLGGGFGRRLPGHSDYVLQCAHIAKAMAPRPVKLTWSREEDMSHDYYRPAVWARMRGALDDRGRISVWGTHFTALSHEPDLQYAHRIPYDVPNLDMRHSFIDYHIKTGAWRSVEKSWHGFFIEGFMDELAHIAGKDPYQFRREHLENNPRYLAVLDAAAEQAGWGRELPEGRGLGIALVECFQSVVAEVAEVSVSAEKQLTVHKLWCAVDCGYAINPNAGAAQVEGGALYGLSAALISEITIARGRPVESNFRDHLVIHMVESPEIDVKFIESAAPLGGLGEPATPPVAPAVANAVFAATGERYRRLPLSKQGLSV